MDSFGKIFGIFLSRKSTAKQYQYMHFVRAQNVSLGILEIRSQCSPSGGGMGVRGEGGMLIIAFSLQLLKRFKQHI